MAVKDLLGTYGMPEKIVVVVDGRDSFMRTLRAFELYQGWDVSTPWGEEPEISYVCAPDGRSSTVRSEAAGKDVSLEFHSPAVACPPTAVAKLRRVHADRTMAFEKSGWRYVFRLRWSAATLSPGLESLVEQRASPSEYAVVLQRRDWPAYAAGHTLSHVAASIDMKVEDILAVST